MSESSLYLVHHGTKGMKWGRRRWQNSDGSLTPAGVERYSKKADRHKRIGKAHERKADEFESHTRSSTIGSGVGTAASIAMIASVAAVPLSAAIPIAAVGGAATSGVAWGVSKAYTSFERRMAKRHYSEAEEYRKLIEKSGGIK